MITAKDVAQWMSDKLNSTPYLYQEVVVYEIKSRFGDQFVYTNENWNLAISTSVLKEFRKLTDGKVVWERGDKAWRKLNENEPYTGRQVY